MMSKSALFSVFQWSAGLQLRKALCYVLSSISNLAVGETTGYLLVLVYYKILCNLS
jgi:hypothetical protein